MEVADSDGEIGIKNFIWLWLSSDAYKAIMWQCSAGSWTQIWCTRKDHEGKYRFWSHKYIKGIEIN